MSRFVTTHDKPMTCLTCRRGIMALPCRVCTPGEAAGPSRESLQVNENVYRHPDTIRVDFAKVERELRRERTRGNPSTGIKPRETHEVPESAVRAVMSLRSEGLSHVRIAARVGIAATTAGRIIRRHREKENADAGKNRRGRGGHGKASRVPQTQADQLCVLPVDPEPGRGL